MTRSVTVTVEIARPKVTLAETYNGTLRKKYARDTKHELDIIISHIGIPFVAFYIPHILDVAFDCNGER
jgi:hypothetical protein